MEHPRYTQFQGFAKALWIELLYACESKVVGNHLVKVPPTKQEAEAIIAQRAYDLAYHFVESPYEHKGTFKGEIHQSVQMLPDMPELPRVTNE